MISSNLLSRSKLECKYFPASKTSCTNWPLPDLSGAVAWETVSWAAGLSKSMTKTHNSLAVCFSLSRQEEVQGWIKSEPGVTSTPGIQKGDGTPNVCPSRPQVRTLDREQASGKNQGSVLQRPFPRWVVWRSIPSSNWQSTCWSASLGSVPRNQGTDDQRNNPGKDKGAAAGRDRPREAAESTHLWETQKRREYFLFHWDTAFISIKAARAGLMNYK